jgi:hypothetical protein
VRFGPVRAKRLNQTTFNPTSFLAEHHHFPILSLSACRCQHGVSVHARGRPYPPQWSRRRGLLVRNELISEAEAATHSLHIIPPPR